MAASIEGKHPLGGWIEQDRVRILANVVNLVDRLERMQVEDRDGAFSAIAGEPAPQLGSKCNAVNPEGVGNVPDALPSVGVQNDDVGSARDEEMAGASVNVQIVPPSFPAYLIGFDDMPFRTL